MNFDWLNYLKLAKNLAATTEPPELEEARLRASISRAYYAAFSLAKKRVRLKYQIKSNQNSHDKYIQVFFQYDDQAIKDIGVTLQRMRKARNNADYDDEITNIKRLSEDVLDSAEEVISGLNTLPSEGLIQNDE